jgi:hypothetical protein
MQTEGVPTSLQKKKDQQRHASMITSTGEVGKQAASFSRR